MGMVWNRLDTYSSRLDQGIFFKHLFWNRVAKLEFLSLAQGKDLCGPAPTPIRCFDEYPSPVKSERLIKMVMISTVCSGQENNDKKKQFSSPLFLYNILHYKTIKT